MSSSQTYSPFHAVLLREWRRMTSRRLYFGVCIILPLFTLFFMATIFGNGQMENIPVALSIRITLLLRGQSSETYLLCLHLK